MENDFDKLSDGQTIILHPNKDNLLHHEPIKAVYQSGYFYCEGTKPHEGPDYYLGDVLKYNLGYTEAT